MNNQPRVFFKPLEALRGIAALVVIIYHVGWSNPLYELEFFRNGALMVDLFFVLSGFVMVHCYGQYFTERKKLLYFFKSRFWRLYPLHFIMLISFLIIEVIKYIAEVKFDITAGTPAFLYSNSSAFLSHIFLLHSLVEEHGAFNSPSWSISTEFYTYALFACLMLIINKVEKRYLVFFIISSISFLMILKIGHTSLTFDYNGSIFRCIYGFFLGAFTYEIYLILSNRCSLKAINKLLQVFLLILFIISFLFVLLIKHDNFIEFLMPPLTSVLILLLALSPQCIINKILCWPTFLWLGKISYSIYMIHMLFIWFFSAILQAFFKVPKKLTDNGESIISTSQLEGGLMMIIFLVCVLISAHFSHKYIEVRFRTLGNKNNI